MNIKYLCNCPEHIDTVANWIYNEFVAKVNGGVSLEKLIEYFSNTKLNCFPITLIAIVNDQCVGTISIFENDLKNQNNLTPWLASLYVTPNYRSEGIAKKLIDKVKEIVKEMGFTILYLRTEHTAEYYRKLGWSFFYKTHDEKGQETEVFKISLK